MHVMDSLGKRLRQLRQNNRLRQDQVASLVGVNKNTMCSYENDVRQPSYEILVRLATIYRVSTDYLLGCESKRTVDVSLPTIRILLATAAISILPSPRYIPLVLPLLFI